MEAETEAAMLSTSLLFLTCSVCFIWLVWLTGCFLSVFGEGACLFAWVCLCLFTHLFVCLLLVWDRDSLCSLGWCGLCYVDRAGLKSQTFTFLCLSRAKTKRRVPHLPHQSSVTGLPTSQPDGALSYIAFFSDEFSLHWLKKSLS